MIREGVVAYGILRHLVRSTVAVNSPLVRPNSSAVYQYMIDWPIPSRATLLRTEALVGGVIGSSDNGNRDTKCPSARPLAMFWEDTGARSEGTAYAWIATNETVGSTDLCRIIRRSSQ
ncbi:hypothetical protein TNCV_2732521 [Trichonephila clavipes]|nr:hypothetical protein TNCV_2732521 [Trichonephila clavipes]